MARSGTYGTKQNKVEDCRQWPMHHQGGGLLSVAYAPPRWRTVVSGICTTKVAKENDNKDENHVDDQENDMTNNSKEEEKTVQNPPIEIHDNSRNYFKY